MALFDDFGTYTWTIDKPLSDRKVGEKLTSPSFSIAIDNLKCEMKLYPNGSKDDFVGYCMVFFRIVQMPHNWKTVRLCRTIHSPQTKSQQTHMGEYKAGVYQGWKYVLPFVEIKSLQTLQIAINVRILRIQMVNNHIHYPKQLEYQKEHQLSYQLDQNMIQDLKRSCKIGKMVESNILNDMWCIRICPNGSTPRDAGKCVLGLTLCALPHKVSRVKVKWSITCESMNIHSSQESDFSLDSATKGCNIGTFKQFKCLDDLMINIDISILKEYDNQKRKWNPRLSQSKTNGFFDSPKTPKTPKTPMTAKAQREMRSKLDRYDIRLDVLEQTLITYKAGIDQQLKMMNQNIDKMHTKMHKIGEFMTLAVDLNKKNDHEVKELKQHWNKWMAEEQKSDPQLDHQLKKQIEDLQNEVKTLRTDMAQLKTSGDIDQDALTPKEQLRVFLEEEAKIEGFYEAFLEDGYDSIESLFDLTMDDLKEIGIPKLRDRKNLMKLIRGKQQKARASMSANVYDRHTVEGSVSYQQ
eukprot:143724_1